jgi:SAM-dependent methyltransferase
MAPSAAATAQDHAAASIDFKALKARQQAAWSSGDYAVVGTTLQIVGEDLCEALDVRAGQTVLDVAAGNGNVALAAARRWCDVTVVDYVGALLDRARERAAAERLSIEFREADAEALPFADESFDVVVSTFGVMFTPDQDRAAAELVRVCKRGGKIGLANWTPEGFIGQLFKTIGKIPAAARRQVAGAVGHAHAHRPAVRATRVVHQVGATQLRVSLPFARTLARGFQDLLRAGAQDVRGARGPGANGPRA